MKGFFRLIMLQTRDIFTCNIRNWERVHFFEVLKRGHPSLKKLNSVYRENKLPDLGFGFGYSTLL